MEEIERFLKIYELKNLTRAANEIGLAQPSLTEGLSKLESLLNTKLFVRNRKGLIPTESGEITLKYFQEINFLYKKLIEEINLIEKRVATEIRVGMIDNLGLTRISQIYKKFLPKFPQVKFRLVIDNSSRLLEALEFRELDFIIVTKPTRFTPEKFNYDFFQKEKLKLVANPSLAYKIKNNDDLKSVNFLAYNKGSNTFKLIDEYFHKIKVNYTVYSSSPELLKKMVMGGIGISCLPSNIVDKELKAAKLVEILRGEFKIEREFYLLHLKNSAFNDIKQSFLKIISR